jgi:hypothetical protein
VSESVKLIVDGYVRLNDREKIEALREHRRALRDVLQSKASAHFDTSYLMSVIDSDLDEIKAGLARLQ